MSDPLARGLLLYEQERYDLALAQFQNALDDRPEDSEVLAYASLALARLERYSDATETGRRAVAADPERAFAHYALAVVYSERNMDREAEAAIDRALDLEPENPQYLGTAAMVRLTRKKWEEAADLAERGLESDAADSLCLNARSMALSHMGRLEDAGDLLEMDLREDPDNPLTLANLGWAALRSGRRDEALDYFREALRQDPEFGYARDGLLEALRARYPFYGWFLRYFLRMSSLPGRVQWAVLIAGYCAFRALQWLGQSYPEALPWVMPVLLLYLVFAYLSWTARPLTNLLLRLHPYGEAALRREEMAESNLTGACLAGGVGFGFVSLFTGGGPTLVAALVFFTLLIPVSALFACSAGWPRKAMAGLAVLLALLGTGGAAALMLEADALAAPLLMSYLLGFFLAQWGANWLVSVEPRR